MRNLDESLIGQRVDAYRNLHKGCFSVRQKGLVVGHVSTLLLRNASFYSQPAGRAKVRATGRKNVHAGVRGELVSIDVTNINLDNHIACYYNPYKLDSFVELETGQPVGEVSEVVLMDGRCWVLKVQEAA
jgi:hypothetical protein